MLMRIYPLLADALADKVIVECACVFELYLLQLCV